MGKRPGAVTPRLQPVSAELYSVGTVEFARRGFSVKGTIIGTGTTSHRLTTTKTRRTTT